MTNHKLTGVVVPMLTPLGLDETLDEGALARMIEYLLGARVDALLALGTTGEFAMLDGATKSRLVRRTVELAAGRAPVLVGVSGAGTREAVNLGQEAVELGADGVVAAPPYYYAHTQREIISHFTTLAASVEAPLYLYNIPHRAKLHIEPAAALRLAEVPNIVGLKDSSGDLKIFQEFLRVRRARPDFAVFQGSEPNAVAGLICGADGLAVGPSSFAPRLARELYEAVRAGDMRAAFEGQERLTDLCAIYRHRSGVAGMKTAAWLLGLCGTTVCAPFESLTEEQVEAVRRTLAETGVLTGEAALV